MASYEFRYVGADSLPSRLSEFDVQQYFRLSQLDVAALNERFRADRRAGAAVLLLFMRASGRPLDRFTALPKALLYQVGQALDIRAPTIASLRSIYARRQTLYEHQLWLKGYLEAFVPMSTKVSPDFLLKFFERVTGVVATDVFTKPSLYESRRVKEAAMLHALVPRVDSIRYALPTGVSQSESDRVQTLMDEFSQSLQLRKNQIAHGTYDASWGTMLSANSATTLLHRISELGLATYTAVDPTVQYITKSISESLDGAWVFGWELYFHFVKQEPVAKEH